MKKEFFIFIMIIVVLTIVFHYKELLEYPIQHVKNFPNSGTYGLGIFHPLIFGAFVYIMLLIPRAIFKLLKGNSHEENIK
ncbi:hypothetical protein [Arcobacter aquimarinus]|uniref:hypothetical protein n=1 Tax=Arcobacter aquimarinus TaxID=1315211 RepID=UPI003BB1F8CA